MDEFGGIAVDEFGGTEVDEFGGVPVDSTPPRTQQFDAVGQYSPPARNEMQPAVLPLPEELGGHKPRPFVTEDPLRALGRGVSAVGRYGGRVALGVAQDIGTAFTGTLGEPQSLVALAGGIPSGSPEALSPEGTTAAGEPPKPLGERIAVGTVEGAGKMVPALAGAALTGGATLPLWFGGQMGLSAYGETGDMPLAVRQAAIGALLGQAGKLGSQIGEQIAFKVTQSIPQIANQGVVESMKLAGQQTALNYLMTAGNLPELMQEFRESPEKAVDRLAEQIGVNLAFAAPGLPAQVRSALGRDWADTVIKTPEFNAALDRAGKLPKRDWHELELWSKPSIELPAGAIRVPSEVPLSKTPDPRLKIRNIVVEEGGPSVEGATRGTVRTTEQQQELARRFENTAEDFIETYRQRREVKEGQELPSYLRGFQPALSVEQQNAVLAARDALLTLLRKLEGPQDWSLSQEKINDLLVGRKVPKKEANDIARSMILNEVFREPMERARRFEEQQQTTVPTGEGPSVMRPNPETPLGGQMLMGVPDPIATAKAVKDIFKGAAKLFQPRPGTRGGIVDPYTTPMLERLDLIGGPQSKRVSDAMRKVDSRSLELAGGIAPVVDKARSLAAKALRGGTTWIRGLDKVNDTAAIGRLHTLEGTDRNAVVAKAPPNAREMVGALWDANVPAIGGLAQRANVGFVPTGKIQRILTNRGLATVREGGGAVWERWVRGLAEANNLPVPVVERMFRDWKAELDKPSPDVATLDKIAQDFTRVLPKAVSHVKLGPAWIEMLVSDPVDYLNAATERTARSAAFREQYPATQAGRTALANDRQAVMAELPTARHEAEFDNLIRTVQGHPLDRGVEQLLSASTPSRIALGEAVAPISRPIKSGMLSLASVANAAETLIGGPQIFMGFRNVLPLLLKNPIRFYQQLEMAGMVNRATRNFAFNPAKPIDSISRMISEGIGRVTMNNFFNEVQEYTGSGAARVLAERVRRNDLSEGERKDFEAVLRAMGLRDRASRIATGQDAEGLAMFEREAAPFLSMGHQRPAVVSRLGNSRAFNSLFWFHRYPQMVLNQFRGITNSLIESVRSGNMEHAYRDGKLMAKFLGMRTAQGVLATLLVALVKQGISGVGDEVKRARESFASFMLASFAQSIGGPLTLANRMFERVHSAEDVPKELVKAMPPVSAAMDTLNALTGKRQYSGKDLSETVEQWIQSKTPALVAAKNALNRFGAVETPSFARGQIARVHREWLSKHPNQSVREDYESGLGRDREESRYADLYGAIQRRSAEDFAKAKAALIAKQIDSERIDRALADRYRPEYTTKGKGHVKHQDRPLFQQNREMEDDFESSLTPEQRKIYQKALAEREADWNWIEAQ